MQRRPIYLFMAVLGSVGPYVLFITHAMEVGLTVDPLAYMWPNALASGFVVDLFIASFVFWIWLFEDLRQRGTGRAWPFIALNLTIGLSCALPAYLWWRGSPEGTR